MRCPGAAIRKIKRARAPAVTLPLLLPGKKKGSSVHAVLGSGANRALERQEEREKAPRGSSAT